MFLLTSNAAVSNEFASGAFHQFNIIAICDATGSTAWLLIYPLCF
jgi:hypothetical protein